MTWTPCWRPCHSVHRTSPLHCVVPTVWPYCLQKCSRACTDNSRGPTARLGWNWRRTVDGTSGIRCAKIKNRARQPVYVHGFTVEHMPQVCADDILLTHVCVSELGVFEVGRLWMWAGVTPKSWTGCEVQPERSAGHKPTKQSCTRDVRISHLTHSGHRQK